MCIELIEQAEAHAGKAARYSDVPAASAIQGFYGVTLLEQRVEPTAALLDVMGLKALERMEPMSDSLLPVMLSDALWMC